MEFKLNQDSLRFNYFHAALLDSNFLCSNTKQDESEAAALKTTRRMSKDNYSSYRRVFVLSNEMTSVSTSSTLVGGH